MTKFIYPTLDLFLYDLREGLGQTEAEVEKNRKQFKQKLPQINNKEFERRDAEFFEPEYVELLGAHRYSQFDSDSYKGYHYPVRLSDTYGLLLDCSLKADQQDDDLQWISDLRAYISDQLNGQTGTVGQTWMFSAQLPNVSIQEYEFFAKRCYEALIPDASFSNNKTRQSGFLGGRWFECWQPDTLKLGEINVESHHVMIALYPNEQTMQAAASFYPDFMRLLMYRHKMMWAYAQSRKLKKRLKAGAIKIEETRKELERHSIQRFNADKFQQTLDQAWKILSDYTTALNRLALQAATMKTNLGNYQKRLALIEDKAAENLAFLKPFSAQVQEKYLLQVQTDHNNLTPELRLLENIIEYIRARVAIEEERRDRSFQETIATWGIGLAAGAIVASLSGQFPTPVAEPLPAAESLFEIVSSIFTKPEIWHQPGTSIVLSLGAALSAGLLTKLLIWLRRRR